MNPSPHAATTSPLGATATVAEGPARGANDNARPVAAAPPLRPQVRRVPTAQMSHATRAALELQTNRTRWQRDIGPLAPDLRPLDALLPEIDACEHEMARLHGELATLHARVEGARLDAQKYLDGIAPIGSYPHLAAWSQTLRSRPELDALDEEAAALRAQLREREDRHDDLRAQLRELLERCHAAYARRALERPTLSGQGGAIASLLAAVRAALAR